MLQEQTNSSSSNTGLRISGMIIVAFLIWDLSLIISNDSMAAKLMAGVSFIGLSGLLVMLVIGLRENHKNARQ